MIDQLMFVFISPKGTTDDEKVGFLWVNVFGEIPNSFYARGGPARFAAFADYMGQFGKVVR